MEKKQSIGQRIFNLVRDIPNLTEENVHEFMSKDMKYKTGSGKAIIYRMICAKYIRRDKNGILHAHLDEYKPMPPYKPKRKKKVAKPIKAVEVQPQQDQADKFREAALNAVTVAGALVETVAKQPPPKPVKKDFLVELGRRIGSYFRA